MHWEGEGTSISYNPYTQVSITNYNTNPPPDDGSSGADNQVNWAKHKTKIGDPLKTAIESLNTNVFAAFGKLLFGSKTAIGSDYTITSADAGKVIAVSGSPTITLPSANSVGEGFTVTILNVGSGIVDIVGTGGETINNRAIVDLPGRHDAAIISSDGTDYVGLVSRKIGETGEFTFVATSTALNGSLRCTGETIGSAASAATYKGEKYRPLFDKIKGQGWGNLGSEDFDSDDTVALPSARDRLPIGGGNLYTHGGTGGDATATPAGTVGGTALLTAHLPVHNHSFSDSFSTNTTGSHNHTYNYRSQFDSAGGTAASNYWRGQVSNQSTSSDGAHQHTGSVSGSTGNTGSGSTHTHSFTGNSMSIIPPYFAGLWCIVY